MTPRSLGPGRRGARGEIVGVVVGPHRGPTLPTHPTRVAAPYHGQVMHPPAGDTWVGLSRDPMPIAVACEWAVRPDCGALVLFAGTARDHAPGRPGVTGLEYEAYEELIGEASVVVAVSSPHRPEAFEAGRFAIEALKSSVPIWKRETWDGGEDWSVDGHEPVEAREVGR